MDAPRPRPPVIAVFGSDEDKFGRPGLGAIARNVGAAVVREGGIVLTGGRNPGTEEVRELAIRGAMDAEGRWIGIGRRGGNEDVQRNPDVAHDDRSFELTTNLGHKRNYLEACLCDAAIALLGGDGTTSEVAFCLSLGKPVFLIGNWGVVYDGEKLNVDGMVRAALGRVGAGSGYPGLGELLQENALRKAIRDESKKADRTHWIVRRSGAENPEVDDVPEAAVSEIFERLGTAGTHGGFPRFGGTFDQDYEEARRAYEGWRAS